jgi:hypothetical protein
MKDEDLEGLVVRIRQELDEIRIALKRVDECWERARRSNDDYYIDSVALNLHGFYMGAEKIFAHIAEIVDSDVPDGENWHYLLLRQMTAQVAEVRPPVISEDTGIQLDAYRKFRHIVRNVYAYHFDPVKIGELVAGAFPLFERLNAELTAFVNFLERA